MPASQQITFRGMEPSEAVRRTIEKRIEGLDRACGCITGCHVVVETPHRHRRKGRLFHISIDMTLPGRKIVINRERHERRAHEDVYVAIRDVFDAAREEVEEYVLKRKGKVKSREMPAHGTIVRILSDRDCGFIATPDGQEVYFHRHSILGKDLEALMPGMEVRFSMEQGDQGPQASSVSLIGKHHIVG